MYIVFTFVEIKTNIIQLQQKFETWVGQSPELLAYMRAQNMCVSFCTYMKDKTFGNDFGTPHFDNHAPILPQDRNKIWVEDGEMLDWTKCEAKRQGIFETPIERNNLDLQVTNEIA